MNLIEKPILKLIQRKVSNWFDLERSQAQVYNGFASTDGSPEKSWPDPAKIPSGEEIPFTFKNVFIVGKYLKSSSIDDLPFAESNPHSWIGGFCDTCGRCIRSCPEEAIRERPLIHDSGRKTHIFREKCLPFFVTRHGCTICVKECSFAKRRYEDIYKSFVRLQGN